MEGSGRMVVVGVGLNSQVGTIMGLLGATGDGSKSKKKKKKEKKKSKSKSSTKVSPSSSNIGEKRRETAPTNERSSRVRQLPPLGQSIDDEQEMKPIEKANNADGQEKKSTGSRPTTAESIEPKVTGAEKKKKSVAADSDSAPEGVSNDSKHKCK